MQSSSLSRFPLSVLSASLFALIILGGCQLLRPYQAPITPTPDQWKRTYDAPDAGQPTIPQTWKEKASNQNSPQEQENDKSKSIEIQTDHPSESIEPKSNESISDSAEAIGKEPTFEEVCNDLDNWWEIFKDPTLNELEAQALNSSYTLWAALERVIEARAIARINFSPLLPSINFSPSFTRYGQLIQSPISNLANQSQGNVNRNPCVCSSFNPCNPANQALNSQSAINQIPNSFRFVQTQYLVPLNLNYEVDLWSRLNNAYYAALIRAQAASQAYLSVLLSLTADVAAAYFQLRGLDAQQEVIERNILVRKHAVEINQARYDAGLIVFLDVSRAQVELARARSDSDNIRRLRGLQENVLATLVGTPAPVFCIKANPVIIPPPVVPTGLPSELLCRRPDIAEAERNLAAAYRDVGVAYANFFPSLNLNASLGFSSPFAHNLFSWKARFWEVGWNVFQTVFDAGRTEANFDYYKALFREAMANYQEIVLESFKDVEDSLVNLKEYANQAQDLATAVRAAQVTLDLAQIRYDRGLINYLDVVDAERQLLETEQNSVIVLGNRYVSTVMLIRALGGGWGPCETCSE